MSKMKTENAKKAPHNLEVEQALLGAIFVNNEAYDAVVDFLKAEHFALKFHSQIFTLIQKSMALNKLVSPITLKNFLDPQEMVGEFTAYEYLVYLSSNAVSVIQAPDYARVIYDLFLRRSLINIGESITNRAYESKIEDTPNLQIEDAEKNLYQLAENGQKNKKFEKLQVALTKAIEMATAAHKRSNKLSGLATYIHSLDQKLGGLQPSDLIIIAGRPGMGKTALATNIAFNIANTYNIDKEKNITEGGIVGFCSLEMSSEQLATRLISEQSEVNASNIRKGNINEEEFNRILQVMNDIQNIPLYIDETGGISIAQLVARARRQKRQHGLDVLIIDYIQLLSGSTRRSHENRVQEITEITTNLKSLAKELNVPIIALSQLSRQVESREDKRPQLSDLRESGSIEQDADIVLFVYREEYYKKTKEPALGTDAHLKWQEEMSQVHNKAEVIVAKHRHAATGTVQLAFFSEFTRFSDLADDAYYPKINE